jgi:hypothetical protein
MGETCPLCESPTKARDFAAQGVLEFTCCGAIFTVSRSFLPTLAGLTKSKKERLAASLRTICPLGSAHKPFALGSKLDIDKAISLAGSNPEEMKS